MECIFCGIVNRSLPAELIYESDLIVAFRDITPQGADARAHRAVRAR